MYKVRKAMSSSGKYPRDGAVHVDEFLLGGYEEGKIDPSYDVKKKKASIALQLTDMGNVKLYI